MIDLLRATFLDRLQRLDSLEAALAEQEQLLLGDVPRFFRHFRKKVSNAREGIEKLLPILAYDPLNEFLKALQEAGVSWGFERSTVPGAGKGSTWAYGESPEEKVEFACFYLRVCKALFDSKKPMNIQDLKPLVKPFVTGGSRELGARDLSTLCKAGLIEAAGEERRPYIFYQLTDLGRRLVQAILGK